MKQPVVTRNQFTNVNNHSHGKTPSNFVKDYTIRKDATELVYPVSTTNSETPVLSVTNPNTQVQQLKENEKAIENDYLTTNTSGHIYRESLQMEGRCFDLNNISLSSENIYQTTDDIQKAFNDAHTVMLLVVSFDTEYLKELNVLNQNEEYKLNNNPIDHFKYNTDELKLRLAVRNSVKRLSERLGYEKPIAIGSIQLDTDNPHAHIVLTETETHDKSRALKFYDGTEWGTLNPKQIKVFENTIHNQLILQKDLTPENVHGIQTILDYSQDLKQNYGNLKIYGQLSGLSILPDESEYSTDLKHKLKLETRISDKHLNKIQSELKKASPDELTNISPYLKIQFIPLANQIDLPENIQQFSQKKRVKYKIDSDIKSEIKKDQTDLINSIRTNSTTEELNFNQTRLLRDLYIKEENNKYIYKKPLSNEAFTDFQENIEMLYESNLENDSPERFPIIREHLFDTLIDANIERLISTDNVKSILDSNFKIRPELSQDYEKTKSDRIVDKIIVATKHLDSVKELIDSKDIKTTTEVTHSIINEREIIKSLQEIPKIKTTNVTISKDNALDILHDMKDQEQKYGPDF